jgi:ParB family chromosome partitioning protein
MTDPSSEIRMIPVHAITVINPRSRNKRIFNELVTSIACLGLKKPITVSEQLGLPNGYDLVCGQGRLEAFIQLGQTEIPAIVINASEEDRHVMSLVENLARRRRSSLELMREIGVLSDRGYTTAEIAAKTGFTTDYIAAICYLLEHGENRLLIAVDRGVMPANIAIEIARAPESEVQRALAEAYEARTIPGNQILTIRRIIQQREQQGKGRETGERRPLGTGGATASGLIRAYQREVERQKLLLKKSELAKSRMAFIVNALDRLLKEQGFMALLHANEMRSIPRPLAERLDMAEG